MIKDPENIGLVEATKDWKKFHWFLQVLITVVGLIVVLSSSYALYRGIDIYRRYFPLVKASIEMRLKATTSYLWFEEMLGGDASAALAKPGRKTRVKTTRRENEFFIGLSGARGS